MIALGELNKIEVTTPSEDASVGAPSPWESPPSLNNGARRGWLLPAAIARAPRNRVRQEFCVSDMA